ncbi:TadE/TadG family type IV pilus assembly protein [Nocardiopsis oceani]
MKQEELRDDRGSADMLVALPLLFAMLIGLVQYGLWAHAQHRAQAAAAEALAAGRVFEGSAREGRMRGEAFAEGLGGRVLEDLRVHVERRDGTAHARVEAVSISLIPGFTPTVSASLSGPIEQPPTEAR